MAAFSNTVTPCSPVQVVSLQGSGKCMAEYIWIGATGADLKSRTVVLDEKPSSPDDLPIAEVDGSVYGQAAEEHCEIYLQPRKIFPDPFRGGDHILVLCDIYVPPMACSNAADAWDKLQPHPSNHRPACEAVMQQAAYHQPIFSMQQDYNLYNGGQAFEGVTDTSFGGLGSAPMPIKAMPAGLSAKASARLGRDVSELHMQACLAAGISYSGSHTSGTSQWAYKVGPCAGIDIADQVCISRFLLGRVAEHSGAELVYDSYSDGRAAHAAPSKCTISFSTATSRDPACGLSEVQCMMERLHVSHLQHALALPLGIGAGGQGSWHSARDAFGAAFADCSGSPPAAADAAGAAADAEHHSASSSVCGSGGSSSFCAFTVGVGNKHASIMVPTSTLINRCGPILDRRPPASADPYLAVLLLTSAACGLQLPTLPQLNAAQLAAALAASAAAAAAATGSISPAGRGGTVPIPAASLRNCKALDGSLPGSLRSSFGEPSLGSASGSPHDNSFGGANSFGTNSFGSSVLAGSVDSRDMLLSELDRIDGYRGSRTLAGIKRSHACSGSGYHSDGACSDTCSDASSPPVRPGGLAAACGDEDMY